MYIYIYIYYKNVTFIGRRPKKGGATSQKSAKSLALAPNIGYSEKKGINFSFFTPSFIFLFWLSEAQEPGVATKKTSNKATSASLSFYIYICIYLYIYIL